MATATKAAKKGAARKKPDARLSFISAVVFEVRMEDPSNEWKTVEVLERLFARTGSVQFQSSTKARYQAGDFARHSKNVWTGRLALVRETFTHEGALDPSKGYVFNDEQSEPVTTSETSTEFAYHAEKALLVFRDRSGIPFTRIQSYVRAALDMPENEDLRDAGVTLTLQARKVKRTIREWFDAFSEVTTFSITYGHSQSPGNRAVDHLLEAFNARERRETIVAKTDEALDVERLLDTKNEVGRAIEHLDVNEKNGHATLHGVVSEEKLDVDTRQAVERHRRTATMTRRGVLAALVQLAFSLKSDSTVASDDDDEEAD